MIILPKGSTAVTKKRADTCVLLEDWTDTKEEVKVKWTNTSWPPEQVNTTDLKPPGNRRTRNPSQKGHTSIVKAQSQKHAQEPAKDPAKQSSPPASPTVSRSKNKPPSRPQKKPRSTPDLTTTKSSLSTAGKPTTAKTDAMVGKKVAVWFNMETEKRLGKDCDIDGPDMSLIKTKKITKNTFDGAVIRANGKVDDLDGDYQALYMGIVMSVKDKYGERVVRFKDESLKIPERDFDFQSYKKYKDHKDRSIIRFFPEEPITTKKAINESTEEATKKTTEEDRQEDASILSFFDEQKESADILISKYETKIRELEAENSRLRRRNEELSAENKRLKKTPGAEIT